MENKINIAEILKDCPSGMELDCTLLEGLEFDSILDNEYLPIRCRVKNPNGGYNVYNFTKYGCWFDTTFAKCVIFPKGKTTWEGFQSPFKDGDILVGRSNQPFIFKKLNDGDGCYSYCGIGYGGEFVLASTDWTFANSLRFATEEEKKKLFDAIKANGYHWNAETKTLEKLIEPKFKVGDVIKHKEKTRWVCTIARVGDRYYVDGHPMCFTLPFGKQNDYELVPNKFDITTLVPFDKVLVRNKSNEVWTANFYSHYDATSDKPFICVGWSEMNEYRYCVPYEVNKELLGTTDDCDECFKNW